MEASIREPNIKHFTRLVQCAAKYGDDLCMAASKDSWELMVTNSTKSAYVCFTLDPAFFSRYKAHGNPAEQARGVKCQLYAKSVLAVLGKSSAVNPVERIDLKIYDPEGGLRARNGGSDSESDDDVRVASRTAHLEIKLVYHHGITKKHFLHLHASEGLRVVVDTEEQPSGFLISAQVLRSWLDHFNISFGASTSANGSVRGDSHLAWQFGKGSVKIKNYENVTTSVLSTEVTLDTKDFAMYELQLAERETSIELSLPMREFKSTLQLAESLGMDLDFWFSESGQPMVMTSRFLGNDRYGNERDLFKIFCALATTTTEAFSRRPSNTAPRERVQTLSERPRSMSRSVKSQTPSQQIKTEPGLSRRSSVRPRASLTMAPTPDRAPPMVTVSGTIPLSQGGLNGPEPLFQPGPSQGSVRMSQQEVLDMAGMGDLDLEAMLDDAEEEDQAEMEQDNVPAEPDIPDGWEDIEADFANVSAQRASTQREDITAAQQRQSGASSISQRPFSLSRHGSSSDSIRPVPTAREAGTLDSIAQSGSGSREISRNATTSRASSSRNGSVALSREPSRNGVGNGSRQSVLVPDRTNGVSREPSRAGSASTTRRRSREDSAEGQRPTPGRSSATPEFQPDLTIFGGGGEDEEAEEAVFSDDEQLGPTQKTQGGRVFQPLFDD